MGSMAENEAVDADKPAQAARQKSALPLASGNESILQKTAYERLLDALDDDFSDDLSTAVNDGDDSQNVSAPDWSDVADPLNDIDDSELETAVAALTFAMDLDPMVVAQDPAMRPVGDDVADALLRSRAVSDDALADDTLGKTPPPDPFIQIAATLHAADVPIRRATIGQRPLVGAARADKSVDLAKLYNAANRFTPATSLQTRPSAQKVPKALLDDAPAPTISIRPGDVPALPPSEPNDTHEPSDTHEANEPAPVHESAAPLLPDTGDGHDEGVKGSLLEPAVGQPDDQGTPDTSLNTRPLIAIPAEAAAPSSAEDIAPAVTEDTDGAPITALDDQTDANAGRKPVALPDPVDHHGTGYPDIELDGEHQDNQAPNDDNVLSTEGDAVARSAPGESLADTDAPDTDETIYENDALTGISMDDPLLAPLPPHDGEADASHIEARDIEVRDIKAKDTRRRDIKAKAPSARYERPRPSLDTPVAEPTSGPGTQKRSSMAMAMIGLTLTLGITGVGLVLFHDDPRLQGFLGTSEPVTLAAITAAPADPVAPVATADTSNGVPVPNVTNDVATPINIPLLGETEAPTVAAIEPVAPSIALDATPSLTPSTAPEGTTSETAGTAVVPAADSTSSTTGTTTPTADAPTVEVATLTAPQEQPPTQTGADPADPTAPTAPTAAEPIRLATPTPLPLPSELQALEASAIEGNRQAQHDLGAHFAAGRLVDQDFTRAAYWFQEAAIRGVGNAQYNLGVLLQQGLGVEASAETAVQWYRRAAQNGHVEAQYNMGVAYADGIGVDRNIPNAVRWFEQAAAAGIARAAFNLGVMYEVGMLGSPDLDAARQWYRQAATSGDRDADDALERLNLE